MDARVRTAVELFIAACLGAGYGLWGLEAASPLAIPLILWAVLVLLVMWRRNPEVGLFGALASAFVVGFAAVWSFVLGRLLVNCQPPSCQTADPATDAIYAAALLVPLLSVGSIMVGVRKRVRQR